MSIRGRMTHRCTIERDSNAGSVDSWGNPVAPSYADNVTNQPCYVYQPAFKNYALGELQERANTTIVGWELFLPKGTDVTDKDRIADVVDRVGDTIADETFNIVQVLRNRKCTHLIMDAVISSQDSEITT